MNNRIASIAGVEYTNDYERGWRASRRGVDGALDRAGSDAWVDGYMDEACGREKWHAVTHYELGNCADCGLSRCAGCDWNKEVCESGTQEGGQCVN